MKKVKMCSFVVSTKNIETIEDRLEVRNNKEQCFKKLLSEGMTSDVIEKFNTELFIDLNATRDNLFNYLFKNASKNELHFDGRTIALNMPYHYSRTIRALIYLMSNEGIIESFRVNENSRTEVMIVTLHKEFKRAVQLDKLVS